MRARRRLTTRKRIVGTVALLVTLTMVQVFTSMAAVSGVSEIATGGFGNPHNAYSWSMAWFKGRLYVGTAASPLCVENALLDYYYPGFGLYTAHPADDLSCTPDKYDLDLRAEIWRYTPGTGTWERVFQSPTIPNPHPDAAGKQIARDIGYRGMAVMTDGSGNETLLIGGVTAGEYIPQLLPTAPARILKTTDGTTFTDIGAVAGKINTSYGEYDVIGYRGIVVINNRVFATASQSYVGDGAVVEVINPLSGAPSVVQVSPNNLSIFEIESFNNNLYLGTGAPSQGYGVWKAALGPQGSQFNFSPIVTNGAGRGTEITSVVAMHVYRDRLYVGASGWYSTIFPGSELIRIAANDSWQLVVGNTRQLPNGSWAFPISGLGDGYGNVFNAHFWRMEDLRGALYLGTNDWSWSLRTVPLVNILLYPQFGFDVYSSCDGQYWSLTTMNAFGDGVYNFGARTMQQTPSGMFVGSANHSQGTAVWLANPTQTCRYPGPWQPDRGTRPGRSATVEGPLDSPSRLVTEQQPDGMLLSWDAVDGAAEYTIKRASYATSPGIEFGRSLAQERGFVPEFPPPVVSTNDTSNTIDVLGEFTEIGTTTDAFFTDTTASPGTEYVYQVVAKAASGDASAPSNSASSETATEGITFSAVRASVSQAAGRGDLVSGGQDQMMKLLTRAEWATSNGYCSVAAKAFDTLQKQIYSTAGDGGVVASQTTREDLGDQVMRLGRHVTYGSDACR